MRTERRPAVTLTDGPIGKQIILFTLPLLLGNLFQQFYNSADSVIVGKFVGKEALAAVGSSSSLINLMISLFMGISMGASVVIARYFGAKDYQGLRDTIHTTIAFGLCAGVCLSALGVLATPTILRWMDTPESVMPGAVVYFRTYFSGALFNIMYNVGSGIFRAVGDSRRPLYFLVISSCVNICLDLLFVAVLDFGIIGAAIATVMSQCLSMVMVYWKLSTDNDVYRVNFREIRIHRQNLRNILAVGLPSGLQNAVVSLSNVVVQRNINAFGDIAMAGCAAYSKMDGFALMPSGSFAMALSTFVSQNIGAKKYDRAKKGAAFGLCASMLIVETSATLIYLNAQKIISLFSSDPEVIRYGVMMTHNIVFFYCLVAYSHGMSGVLRGAGLSKIPMYVMLTCWCGFRVLWLQFVLPLYPDIRMVFWVYPISWALSAIILTVYFFKSNWLHKAELR